MKKLIAGFALISLSLALILTRPQKTLNPEQVRIKGGGG